jgi:hypothetical protein
MPGRAPRFRAFRGRFEKLAAGGSPAAASALVRLKCGSPARNEKGRTPWLIQLSTLSWTNLKPNAILTALDIFRAEHADYVHEERKVA